MKRRNIRDEEKQQEEEKRRERTEKRQGRLNHIKEKTI